MSVGQSASVAVTRMQPGLCLADQTRSRCRGLDWPLDLSEERRISATAGGHSLLPAPVSVVPKPPRHARRLHALRKLESCPVHRRLNEYAGDMPPAVLEQVHYVHQQTLAAG